MGKLLYALDEIRPATRIARRRVRQATQMAGPLASLASGHIRGKRGEVVVTHDPTTGGERPDPSGRTWTQVLAEKLLWMGEAEPTGNRGRHRAS